MYIRMCNLTYPPRDYATAKKTVANRRPFCGRAFDSPTMTGRMARTILLFNESRLLYFSRYAWKTCSHLFLELILFINTMTFSDAAYQNSSKSRFSSLDTMIGIVLFTDLFVTFFFILRIEMLRN